MRDINDFNGVAREGCWIAGCVALATAFCYLAPEYGYSPVPFFSFLFYVLFGVARVLVWAWRRNSPKFHADTPVRVYRTVVRERAPFVSLIGLAR